MKVFKFYSKGYYYAYSGETEEEAKDCLLEEVGKIIIDKVKEIPESEWDKKIISIWEGNDYNKKPYKESIRNQMLRNEPQLIFTNDTSMF
jgi:hypothetical protein